MTDSDPSDYARNVDGKYTCRHCGGGASNLLGGEHIWICSEVVPVEALEELVEQWEKEREKREANTLSNVATLSKEQCAQELQEVIDSYE